MIITYLYHSGFVIETEKFDVVIDYYRDTEGETDGYMHREILPRQKRLYVLSTHFHPDHFNPDVLSWRSQHTDIVYLLSKDILKRRRATREQALWIAKGGEFSDENLSVQAFGSTDVGVSFFLRLADGATLFHAGDLNNWHWNDEVPQAEAEHYEKAYLGELKDICKVVSGVDVAFFPVDARLGKDYCRGPHQFLERVPVRYFFPMHFSANGFASANAFAEEAESLGTKFMALHAEGEQIKLNE